MAWYNNLGQRPRMPTQEEIDAMNAAQQAGRTLKEGMGGQTAADVRRFHAGINPALPQEPPPQNRAGPLSQASIRPAIAAMGSGIQSFAYPEEMQRFARPPVPSMPGPAPAEAAETAAEPAAGQSRIAPAGRPFRSGRAAAVADDSDAAQMGRQIGGLETEGFAPVSSLPGGRDARDKAYLGPNSIMVREGLVGPEAYAAAMQSRQDAEAFGRGAGFAPSHSARAYRPNEATREGAEQGGPMTEYVVPGKGSATFLGERRGGGSFSVVSGPSEEQQAMTARNVAGIDRQTAAMRDLRNAQRQAQGLPTVEQAEQSAAMQRAMPAPPNFRDLDAQAATYQKQMQDAQRIRGIGQGPRRRDQMAAAQAGLAQVNAQRAAMQQDYQTQSAMAQGLFGQQQQQQSAAAKAASDQSAAQEDRRRWEATFGLDRQKEARTTAQGGFKNALEYEKFVRDTLKDRQLDQKGTFDVLKNFMGKDLNGNPTFDEEGFRKLSRIEALSSGKTPTVGKPYFDPATNDYVVYDETGRMTPLGGPPGVIAWKHSQM